MKQITLSLFTSLLLCTASTVWAIEDFVIRGAMGTIDLSWIISTHERTSDRDSTLSAREIYDDTIDKPETLVQDANTIALEWGSAYSMPLPTIPTSSATLYASVHTYTDISSCEPQYIEAIKRLQHMQNTTTNQYEVLTAKIKRLEFLACS
jgi:hypothetical protein